ncbi:NAD(P)-dependent oxidoreductase [Prochlorococcus marinus]|uniref:NAD(P)-dependent oxidoreductase n=1 Tax=Prochlorococcus marinus XMU1408 TaxID=2213228 RepID=A0A318R0C8_PROMR|nr:NAD(P)-dependent oxidoreductase [Prochlorococcus marinus]MBW3041859.1 NAD(P)-dependent oxidoreductase [Prochlorococcus marinus str. XMU1408]PYE02997.1 NAD(P)-dependent oxidoreductase [Prochlorococcus marinus XMU1408]
MKLAFIGLGSIGEPMAERLADNGYDLNLYKRNKLNIDDKKKYFFDPIEAVIDCDGLLICVTDNKAVESVLFGANGVADSLKPNSFVIDFSTISPNKSISLHQRLRKKNVFYVDCPVSGGTEGAHKGSLSLFVGASKKECLSFENIFEVLGESINYFNGVGKGQQVKALNQILVAGTYAAVAEAMELGKFLELPMDVVVNALKVGAANSWPLENRSKAMLIDKHPLGFKLELHHKDLSIAIDLAKSLNIDLPITSRVKEIEQRLMQVGLGELDVSVLHRYISLMKKEDENNCID